MFCGACGTSPQEAHVVTGIFPDLSLRDHQGGSRSSASYSFVHPARGAHSQCPVSRSDEDQAGTYPAVVTVLPTLAAQCNAVQLSFRLQYQNKHQRHQGLVRTKALAAPTHSGSMPTQGQRYLWHGPTRARNRLLSLSLDCIRLISFFRGFGDPRFQALSAVTVAITTVSCNNYWRNSSRQSSKSPS